MEWLLIAVAAAGLLGYRLGRKVSNAAREQAHISYRARQVR